ncbi:MAG: hypothetical protein AVDCRST_MAG56-7264 [uncultured Cytophagales bacterium]|uniref:Uncharacterized protein n=1 Tax=uncultured Cytophagales bacterium TaxID=158755 RepID=A0A6J4LCC5_9SPHI|nr:MAG: hypothetical protein AVDCRST_MAG56-7264 [uncultured Cytophagales bacterium]
MKKYLIYSLLLLSALAASSCRDEDAIRMPQLQEAVNLRVIVDPEKSFLNFENLGTTSYEFDVYSINRNLQQVEFYATYISLAGDTLEPKVVKSIGQSDFVNGKARVVITPTDVANAFGIPGGVAGLAGGDVLNFEPLTTLTDGRTFSAANAAPSITGGNNASFTAAFTTFIGCPSDLPIVRTYTSRATGTTTDPAVSPATVTDLAKEVKITRTGPVSYTISDISGGLYDTWYGELYNVPANLPANITDICGTVGIPTFDDPFEEPVVSTYSRNEATGVITITWVNFYGDTATVVLTPK